jgi:hypothetical protein
MRVPEPEELRASAAATATATPSASHVRLAPLAAAARSPHQRQLLEPARGDDAPNLFATLMTNTALFEAWLPFCLYLVRCPESTKRLIADLLSLTAQPGDPADHPIASPRRVGAPTASP